jgi:hypothetical protein
MTVGADRMGMACTNESSMSSFAATGATGSVATELSQDTSASGAPWDDILFFPFFFLCAASSPATGSAEFVDEEGVVVGNIPIKEATGGAE